MEYALVRSGMVLNIIVLHPMNAAEFPNAVPTNGLPIQVGDEWVDGKFYRDGEEVVPVNILTEAQVAAIKDEAIAEIEEAVING